MSIKEKYLSNSDLCPICDSANISWVTMEFDTVSACRSEACYECGAEWNSVYSLVDINDLRGGIIRAMEKEDLKQGEI